MSAPTTPEAGLGLLTWTQWTTLDALARTRGMDRMALEAWVVTRYLRSPETLTVAQAAEAIRALAQREGR